MHILHSMKIQDKRQINISRVCKSCMTIIPEASLGKNCYPNTGRDCNQHWKYCCSSLFGSLIHRLASLAVSVHRCLGLGMPSVQCVMCNGQCALCNVQCVMVNVKCAFLFGSLMEWPPHIIKCPLPLLGLWHTSIASLTIISDISALE